MSVYDSSDLTTALRDCLLGSDHEGVAEAVNNLAFHAGEIASAVKHPDAAPGKDATGGYVESLTEAVMGVTAGLVQIADAIQSLADAQREAKP